jgi:hypothetical protein
VVRESCTSRYLDYESFSSTHWIFPLSFTKYHCRISKLARYPALSVPEVWFWQDGLLTLYRLRAKGYEHLDRSQFAGLNDLDLALFQRCILMAETNTGEAIRVFCRELEAGTATT